MKTRLNFNTLDIQEGPKGKPFRQTGIRKNGQMPAKWVDRAEKHHWIYTFKYSDGSGYFEVEIDYYDKIVKVNKNV